MRKFIVAVMVILMVMITGCSKQSNDSLKAENVYNSFSAKETDNNYQAKGTVYLSSESDLVNVETNTDTEITIIGKLKRKEGEIKLLYEDANGNTTTLINSEDNQGKTIKIDLSLPISKGAGKFYFSGKSCIYDFTINFSLQENVNYSFE